MTLLTLSALNGSGNFSSGSLFQTNILQSANTGEPWYTDDAGNPVGNPTGLAHDAMTHFGIQMIRFPGGATNDVFAAGMMIDGQLPENVVNMLSYAQANGIKVDMVVPVETPPGMTRATFLTQMTQFAAAVEQEFPGVVTSYELGNEYWGGRAVNDASLEAEYGLNAGQTAAALGAGMTQAGANADVYLQASGNLRGAYGNNSDQANGVIQDAFASAPGAMDALDGVVRNNYWWDIDVDGFENDTGVFAEDRGLEFNLTGTANNWDAWLGREVKTMVGEYNVNRNIGEGADAIDMGIHGASYLLEHMTNMIDAGVDTAFAWPIAHNTQNAYIFRDEDIVTTTVHGMEIATNTTRAAMLDLMRQTLTSHELIDAQWSYGATASNVEVTLFQDIDGGPVAGQGEKIVFLSSRSAESQTVSADLTAFLPNYLSVKAVAIHYESTGDHQRDAVVREVPLFNADGTPVFEIELQPYEVMQLIFVYDTQPAPPVVPVPVVDEANLTAGADYFWGVDVDEIVFGHAGNDTIFARGGDDTVNGGDGNDFIRGGNGNDRLLGERGNDTIYGDTGHDYIMAGAGWDLVDGGFGNDTIMGGGGRDTLIGGHGNDSLYGDDGHDHLMGGAGNDLLKAGRDNDTVDGGAGNDTLYGGFGSDVFVFASGHGRDEIADFSVASGDRIDLSGLTLGIADLGLSSPSSGAARQIGSDVVITTGTDSSITLADIELSSLTAEQFIL